MIKEINIGIDKKKLKQLQDESILKTLDFDVEKMNKLLQEVMRHLADETEKICKENFNGHPTMKNLVYDMVSVNFILNLLMRSQKLKNTYTIHVAEAMKIEGEKEKTPYVGG